MILFTKDLWKKFVYLSLVKKIFIFIGLLFYIFIMVITICKVDYELTTPGVISITTESVKIDTSNKKGNIYTVGVYSTKRITIFEYWISKMNEKLSIDKYDSSLDLNNIQENKLGVITKENSINNAIICAYQNAGYDISNTYQYNGIEIASVYPYDDSNVLEVGDIIIAIDDKSVYDENNKVSISTNDLLKMIRENKDYFKKWNLTIKREGFNEPKKVEYSFYKKIETDEFESGYGAYLCVYPSDSYTIDKTKLEESIPKWTINNQRSIGGSGGAMTALSIYNALTEEDITKGLIVVGTGTIDVFGNVGKIGGLKQKIETAIMYNADIFFIPKENWNEDIELYLKDKHLNYEVVATLSDIIDYFENME